MRKLAWFGSSAIILVAATCRPSQPPPPDTEPGYDCVVQPQLRGLVKVSNAIAGRYIVVLKDRASTQLIQPLMSAQGVSDVKAIKGGYAAQLAAQALQRILADPNVQYVSEDGVKSVRPLAGTPTASWGQDRLDQRALPLDGNYDPGATGEGVNVAIVDTGITNHPDFGGRLQSDCFSAHGACTDGNGHGTHVAGTVAGTKWGVAKKAKLWASRVLNSQGSGSDSDVIRGIQWVTEKKLANPSEQWVLNMSLGGSPAPALDRATCDAIIAGVVVVAAAGNETEDARNSSPGRVRQAITVGATEVFLGKDRQATFSNYGPLLDLYAPGVNIESTSNSGTGTNTFSGTSMASPHVAGGAALYLSRHPGSSAAEVAVGMVVASTPDVVANPGAGSPNRLLYVKED
jgi:subtilisin family serine protease